MAFIKMSEYSENNLPEVAGSSVNVVCENIGSYHPFDISGAVDSINSACENVTNNSNDNCDELKNKIITLGDEWGQKFISIDGSDVNIVVQDQFKDDYSNITNHVQEQVDRCKTIVSDINSRIDKIKEYVQALEENLNEYNELKNKKNTLEDAIASCEQSLANEYNNEQQNNSLISSLEANKNSYSYQLENVNSKLAKYQVISEPEGKWIVE